MRTALENEPAVWDAWAETGAQDLYAWEQGTRRGAAAKTQPVPQLNSNLLNNDSP